MARDDARGDGPRATPDPSLGAGDQPWAVPAPVLTAEQAERLRTLAGISGLNPASGRVLAAALAEIDRLRAACRRFWDLAVAVERRAQAAEDRGAALQAGWAAVEAAVQEFQKHNPLESPPPPAGSIAVRGDDLRRLFEVLLALRDEAALHGSDDRNENSGEVAP